MTKIARKFANLKPIATYQHYKLPHQSAQRPTISTILVAESKSPLRISFACKLSKVQGKQIPHFIAAAALWSRCWSVAAGFALHFDIFTAAGCESSSQHARAAEFLYGWKPRCSFLVLENAPIRMRPRPRACARTARLAGAPPPSLIARICESTDEFT